MRMVDLDNLLLSPEVVVAWTEVARGVVAALALAGQRIDPSQIPDEQARVEDDGSLTIFCEILGIGELSLKVPAGAWGWRQ